ncbi:MAG: fibronectin type III domain-containing protein [bacterium]|nr:fibronectin type III domain-containing protein [bacterium]
MARGKEIFGFTGFLLIFSLVIGVGCGGGSKGSVPASPANLSARIASTTEIDLSWQDNAIDEQGFKLERKIGDAGSYGVHATTSANSVDFTDSGLTPATKYIYRISAYNQAGDSTYSNEVTAQTFSHDIVNQDIDMQASDFECLKNMNYIGPYYLTNKLGADNLADALSIANYPQGGTFPPGTIIQLIPLEAMVKRVKGWNPATNDWEFFALAVTGTTTTIKSRGAEHTKNFANLNCFDCHKKAATKWDLVCGDNHGCDPLPATDAMIKAFQDADSRCP